MATAAIRLNSKQFFSAIARRNAIQLRESSSSSETALGGQSLVQKVVTISDNNSFVVYHPTVDFPYEMSRPLPPPAIPTNELIKEETIQIAKRAFNKKHPEIVRQELCGITYTTKHIWFPRARDKKAKKTPMDREYL